MQARLHLILFVLGVFTELYASAGAVAEGAALGGGEGALPFEEWVVVRRAQLLDPKDLGILEEVDEGGFVLDESARKDICAYYGARGIYDREDPSAAIAARRAAVAADYDNHFLVITAKCSRGLLSYVEQNPWSAEEIHAAKRMEVPRLPEARIIYISSGWGDCQVGLCEPMRSPPAAEKEDVSEGAWVGVRFVDRITGQRYESRIRFGLDVDPESVLSRARTLRKMCLLRVMGDFRKAFADASKHVYPE